MVDAAQVRRATWWIGVLFAIGSTCFLVGPFPGFVELVGSKVDGIVFFVGSIFFTSAAALQYVEGGLFRPRGLDWWSNVIQLAGTLFFNVTTFTALQTGSTRTSTTGSSGRPTGAARSASSCPACSPMPSCAGRAGRATGGSPS